MQVLIRFSFRLFPAVPYFGRKIHREVTFDGVRIPKNASLVVNVFMMGRDERIWGENVMKFEPERFIDSTHKPYEYVPFSAGN